jgi:putative transposase
VIGQPRSSQRYADRKAERDRRLAERIVGLSQENPRYGYRRVWALLRREGWPVNKKRVHRLWRQEGLRVPDKQRKRRRLLLGESENGCTRRRAEHKDHVWSYDFVMDLTEDGRRLKMMPVVDEYTRGCLSIDVGRSITAEDVVETLASLFRRRGEPSYIRSDNGPEFVAEAVKRWLEVWGGWDSLHRTGFPVGERLLGDVHQSLFRRTAKEGGLRRSIGSEGAGGRLPWPL